jgi:hypothetical protein
VSSSRRHDGKLGSALRLSGGIPAVVLAVCYPSTYYLGCNNIKEQKIRSGGEFRGDNTNFFLTRRMKIDYPPARRNLVKFALYPIVRGATKEGWATFILDEDNWSY